jgi:hypothetical protein
MVPQKYWRGIQAREKANSLERPETVLMANAGVKR